MKLRNILVIGYLAAAISVIAGPSSTNGIAITNDLMRVTIKEVCTSTNSSGGLTNQFVGNNHFIQECAGDMGITNLTGLSLVYNRTNNSIDVVSTTNSVSGTNQTIVCTALSFEGGLSITNTNNTRIESLAFVFVGTNTTSTGTISTTTRISYGATNQITFWNLIGRFQYSVAASGTNAAMICRGVLLAGAPIIKQGGGDQDEDEDNNDDDDDGGGGNNGNNGNHGRGNNGHSKTHGNHGND
jgi:hypothetical protein